MNGNELLETYVNRRWTSGDGDRNFYPMGWWPLVWAASLLVECVCVWGGVPMWWYKPWNSFSICCQRKPSLQCQQRRWEGSRMRRRINKGGKCQFIAIPVLSLWDALESLLAVSSPTRCQLLDPIPHRHTYTHTHTPLQIPGSYLKTYRAKMCQEKKWGKKSLSPSWISEGQPGPGSTAATEVLLAQHLCRLTLEAPSCRYWDGSSAWI